MINFETYHEVRRLSRELNLTPCQIAAVTGLNIKTVRKWLGKPNNVGNKPLHWLVANPDSIT